MFALLWLCKYYARLRRGADPDLYPAFPHQFFFLSLCSEQLLLFTLFPFIAFFFFSEFIINSSSNSDKMIKFLPVELKHQVVHPYGSFLLVLILWGRVVSGTWHTRTAPLTAALGMHWIPVSWIPFFCIPWFRCRIAFWERVRGNRHIEPGSPQFL